MSKYVPYKDVAMLALSSMSLLNREWQLTIQGLPTIDIVRCGECKWSKANGTYQWCGRLDSTARITADDFCSHGERSSE